MNGKKERSLTLVRPDDGKGSKNGEGKAEYKLRSSLGKKRIE